jgi:hypothetical protein
MRRRPSAATRDALHAGSIERLKFWLVIAACSVTTFFFVGRLVTGLHRGSLEAPLKGAHWSATFSDDPLLFLFFALIYVLIAASVGFLAVFLVRDRCLPRRNHDPAPTMPTNFSNR